MNPVFTPDGEKVSFLSSENNSRKEIYDLWTIDLATKEQTRIMDFEEAGFYTYGRYDWAGSGEEVYLDGGYDLNYKHDIYKVNIATGMITPVIQSRWHDRNPALSPDHKKIAFISDRTGTDELWVYDQINVKYSQVTGSIHDFDSRYTNLQWLNDEQILITVFDGEKSIAVNVNVH
jgi:Tol biopolymer transport system component